MELSLWQKIQLRISGYTFTRYRKLEGWSGYLPFYVFKCDEHGIQEDYLHGHRNYLSCNECNKVVMYNVK